MIAKEISLGFLTGGGEMGERMRALDWSQTAVGPPEAWPQSLRSAVSICLNSSFPIAIYWGSELALLYNDAWSPIPGEKHPWALGRPGREVWPEIWNDIGPLFERVQSAGEGVWQQDQLLPMHRHGYTEECYFNFTFSPIRSEDGSVAGIFNAVIETTFRVIGERRERILSELAERTARARSAEEICQLAAAVLKSAPVDIPFALFYLPDGDSARVRLVESTALELPRSMIAPFVEFDDPRAPWPLTSAAGSSAILLSDLSTKIGAPIHVESWPEPVEHAVILPLMGLPGMPAGGFLVAGVNPRRAIDTSYLSFFERIGAHLSSALGAARAYQEERARAESLAELDRAKTTFFANISHEFRTPLTLMLGPVEEALAQPALPAATRTQLSLAHRNALRLLKLVNSLLDFSRIEAGRVQASYEPTNLGALTRDLASMFRSTIERAGLRLHVECADLNVAVYVDREMWEKIVLNLLSNAFKFTLHGSITIRLEQAEASAMLTVIDTGVGIAANDITKIFERFHRVEGIQARTHEGSGIGLALIKELVKLHGGSITVESQVNQGACFRVAVPLGFSHLPAARLQPANASIASTSSQDFVQEALRWLPDARDDSSSLVAVLRADGAGSKRDPRFAATYGARIIVADDNADMRAYIQGLLASTYAVETVSNGAEALAAARAQRADLILSDVMMPVLDGFGLLAAVRRDESLRGLPVALLSARAGEEARIEGFNAGADDYLVKPFPARELIARVGALIELAYMRRQSEAALRYRTEQFQTLLNEAPLGVYVVDADFCISEANPTARRAFGDITDLIGQDFGVLIHRVWPAELADEQAARFRHTLDSGEAHYEREVSEQRLDREAREYYEWQISRITLSDGRFGAVCYFRDISDHIQARQVLESSDRQKDEFLAMLAHELRNPLAPIRSAGELLSRIVPQDSRAGTAIGIIQRQIGQLTRLVDDLMDVSRVSHGRIELKRHTVELNALVKEALDTVDPLIREKLHRVSSSSVDRRVHVDGDPIRLVQCIVNLLTNAAKYTDPEGDIRVEVHAINDEAVVRVTDTGAGIAPELLPRIFDLFVQSDRTLDRSQGGLGVGLAVVRRLIEMHAGHVTVRSAGVGCGSTFEIRLPRIEPEASIHAEPTRVTGAKSKRVLIVDDNGDAADALAMILELDGHDAEAVYTAHAALERVAIFKPDIVLLDIGLPEMDGYEVARRLRAIPALSGLRLVALTGYGQAQDRRLSKEAGFNNHLVKPIDPDTLRHILSE